MVAISWPRPTSIISSQIASRAQRARSALFDLCEFHGGDLANRSKANAKWNDRTGNARGGIGSQVVASGDSIEMVVFHSVHYGPYLEMGTSKMPKLGVMAEEVQVTAADVTADAQRVVRGLFG
jgi:hypothetical protein